MLRTLGVFFRTFHTFARVATIMPPASQTVLPPLLLTTHRRQYLIHDLLCVVENPASQGIKNDPGIFESNVARTHPLALANSVRCPSVVCFAVVTHAGSLEAS